MATFAVGPVIKTWTAPLARRHAWLNVLTIRATLRVAQLALPVMRTAPGCVSTKGDVTCPAESLAIGYHAITGVRNCWSLVDIGAPPSAVRPARLKSYVSNAGTLRL